MTHYEEIVKALGFNIDNLTISEYEIIKKIIDKSELTQDGYLVVDLKKE